MGITGSIKNEAGIPACTIFQSTARRRHGEYRNHKHTELEISLILEGEGIYKTTRGDVDIRAGDILLFSTNEFHCITDISTPAMKILNLHIQPSFIWDTGNTYIGNGYLKIFFSPNEQFTNRLPRDNAHNTEVVAHIHAIRREFEEMRCDYEAAIKAELLALLILLRRSYGMTDESTQELVSAPDYSKIIRAMNYMDKNFTGEISLEEIAEESNLSRSYFCTVFRRLNGLTPWDYINIRRVNRALELLRTTDDNILDVALQCGYNNTSNFNRIFRTVTGQTPKAYRDAKRKTAE